MLDGFEKDRIFCGKIVREEWISISWKKVAWTNLGKNNTYMRFLINLRGNER